MARRKIHHYAGKEYYVCSAGAWPLGPFFKSHAEMVRNTEDALNAGCGGFWVDHFDEMDMIDQQYVIDGGVPPKEEK